MANIVIRTLNSNIYSKIKEDRDISLRFSTILGMREYSLHRLIARKDKKLMNFNCIELLRSKGFKDHEIFEPIE